MGHSYGFNRNENLADYASGQRLLLTLIDTVSRGGNLLLNIGPTADGRIPVVMQERLAYLGRWLEHNGEAIYGTRVFRDGAQWTAGRRQEVDTSTNYRAQYDVEKLTLNPAARRCAQRDSVHAQGQSDLYAILPRYPRGELTVRNLRIGKGARIGLLGSRHDNRLAAERRRPRHFRACHWGRRIALRRGLHIQDRGSGHRRLIVWLRTVPRPPRVRPRTNLARFSVPGMQRSRSIVGIAVGVSSLVLIAAGMVAKRAIDQLAITGDAVVAAKERELSFERLLSTLNDAETGQRGYLLSGSDEYLAPYEEALREVEGRISTVVARNQGEHSDRLAAADAASTWSRPSSPSWRAPSSSNAWVSAKPRSPWCAPTRAWRP